MSFPLERIRMHSCKEEAIWIWKLNMDLVVEKVEHTMNIRWAPKKEGEKKGHSNCVQHIYSKILKEKKQTIIKDDVVDRAKIESHW
jgi:TPP-dependent 2-oxoacid decarboxylase